MEKNLNIIERINKSTFLAKNYHNGHEFYIHIKYDNDYVYENIYNKAGYLIGSKIIDGQIGK